MHMFLSPLHGMLKHLLAQAILYKEIGFPQDERLPHFPRSFVLVPQHKLTG